MTGLAVRDLCVRLGGRQVLCGITAAFAPGQVTVILGPNGVGKSTLLACLAGLRSPDQGEVTFDGVSLAAMPPRLRAQRMAVIAQTPEIAWAVDVRVLVGLGRIPFIGARGPSGEDAQAIDRALIAAGVQHLADRDVTTLSGGERARVLIARALAGDPQWLLADEALTGLDPGHQLDAGDLFRTLAHDHGRGVIVTLHDLSLAARVADRILILSEGRILADGPPTEALTPQVLAEAYGIQAHVVGRASGVTIEIIGRTSIQSTSS